MSRRNKKEPVECPACGSLVEQYDGPGRPRRYCNIACKHAYRRQQEAEAVRNALLLLAMREVASTLPED
jgi:hypothetical protein